MRYVIYGMLDKAYPSDHFGPGDTESSRVAVYDRQKDIVFSQGVERPIDRSSFPRPGVYQHYKGGSYTVVATGMSSEDRTKGVTLYVSHLYGTIWQRPTRMFHENVPLVDRPEFWAPRFVYVGPSFGEKSQGGVIDDKIGNDILLAPKRASVDCVEGLKELKMFPIRAGLTAGARVFVRNAGVLGQIQVELVNIDQVPAMILERGTTFYPSNDTRYAWKGV